MSKATTQPGSEAAEKRWRTCPKNNLTRRGIRLESWKATCINGRVSKQILTLREIDRLIAEQIFGIRPCNKWKQISLGGAGGPALIHGDLDNPVQHDYECYPDVQEVQTMQGELGGPAQYTTEIAAAWKLIEHMHELGFGVAIRRRAKDFKYEVELRTAQPVQFAKEVGRVISKQATAPLAICLAALKASGLDVTVRT